MENRETDMYKNSSKAANNHIISIENRERITITDVADVDSFNEETILVNLKPGGLVIKGTNLHLQKLDLQEGKVIISGELMSMSYTHKKQKDNRSMLSKILK